MRKRNSRINRYLSTLLTLLFCCVQGVFAADVPAKPRIVVTDPVFSFGNVPQGNIVTHDFKVKNTGDAPLVIDKAIPSCGCTAVLPPSGPIAPGQETTVTVNFDTAGFSGDKEKTVRLFSNDTESQAPVLTVKGFVETLYDAKPSRIQFGEVMVGDEPAPTTVEVSVKEGSGAKISAIQTFSPSLQVRNISGSDRKKNFEVIVLTNQQSGEIRDRVLVSVIDAKGREQTFNVPVTGIIRNTVQLKPQTVSFGVIGGNSPLEKKFVIDGKKIASAQIIGIETNAPAVTASVKPYDPKKGIVGSVIVDPKLVTSDLRAVVRLKLSGVREKELLLNVYGVRPPKNEG